MYRSFQRRSRIAIKSGIAIKATTIAFDDDGRKMYKEISALGGDIVDIITKTGQDMIVANAGNFKQQLALIAKKLDDLKNPFLQKLKGNDNEKDFVKKTIDYFVEAIRQTIAQRTHPDLILAFISGSDEILDELLNAVYDFQRVFHGQVKKNNDGQYMNQIDINYDKDLYKYRNEPRLLAEAVGADWVLQFSDSQKPNRPEIDDTIHNILNDVDRKIPDKKQQQEAAEIVEKTPLQKRQERFAELLRNIDSTGTPFGESTDDRSGGSSHGSGSHREHEDAPSEHLDEFKTASPNGSEWNAFLRDFKKAVADEDDMVGVEVGLHLFYRDDFNQIKEASLSKAPLYTGMDSLSYGNVMRLIRDPNVLKDRPVKLDISVGNNTLSVSYSDIGKITGHLSQVIKDVADEEEQSLNREQRNTSDQSESSDEDRNIPKVDKDKLPKINPMNLKEFSDDVVNKLISTGSTDGMYDLVDKNDVNFYAHLFNNRGDLIEYPLTPREVGYEDIIANMQKYYDARKNNDFSGMPIGKNYDKIRLGIKWQNLTYDFLESDIKNVVNALRQALYTASDELGKQGKSVFIKQKALKHAYRMYKEMLYK